MEASWLQLILARRWGWVLMDKLVGGAVDWWKGVKLNSRITFLQDNCMHSINWAVINTSRKVFFAFHGTSNNVANERVFLRQVSGEVHLLPLEPLPNAQPWEAKVWADRGSFNEIKKTILRINVYALRMHLLIVFFNPECLAIPVLVL